MEKLPNEVLTLILYQTFLSDLSLYLPLVHIKKNSFLLKSFQSYALVNSNWLEPCRRIFNDLCPITFPLLRRDCLPRGGYIKRVNFDIPWSEVCAGKFSPSSL